MTPEEQREIVERLLSIWEEHPYLRLAQLVAGGSKTELYYFDDQSFIKWLEQTYPVLPPPPPPRPRKPRNPVWSEEGKNIVRTNLNKNRKYRHKNVCDFCGELGPRSKKSTIRYRGEGDFALCPDCFKQWEAKPDGATLIPRARQYREQGERNRRRVAMLLAESPNSTLKEMAERAGCSHETVRKHKQRLTEESA